MSEIDWHSVIEGVYREVSPRDDPDAVGILKIDVLEPGVTCKADVNPPGGAAWIDSAEELTVDGLTVKVHPLGEVSHEQRIRVMVTGDSDGDN